MISIDREKCIGCGKCVRDCFSERIEITDGKAVSKGWCMECGHCLAICPANAISLPDYDMSEVMPLAGKNCSIDPEVYMNHIRARRSIRSFKSTPVSEEEINTLIEIGRFSPTGSNLQNVSYFVSREDIDNFKAMIFRELRKMGEAAASTDMNSMYARKWISMHDRYFGEGKDSLFFDAGTVIVISSPSPQAAMIAAAHMETMVYSMGLGMLYSGFTTRAINNSAELREYISLKENAQVYAVLVIGHPDVEYLRTVPRKKADVIFR